MKIPLYLRIILPLTIVACGYAMWSDSTPDEPMTVAVKSVKVNRAQVVEKKQVLPQLAAFSPRNLFPYQGPPITLPSVPTRNAEAARTAVAPAPVPARAPVFPFHVSGVWNDGAHRKIILTKNDKGHETVILCQGCDKSAGPNVGDVIDKHYRLEKIENERITFTYLPLKLEQTVDLDKAFTETGK